MAGGIADSLTMREAVSGLFFGYPGTANRPVLVASFKDEQTVTNLGKLSMYLEHGAGQSYAGDPASAKDPSYSGGQGHKQCILFLCPNQVVADRWKVAYPDTPVAVVGCPKLDPWHQQAPTIRAQFGSEEQRKELPTVVISFHSQAQLVFESTSAYMHFAPAFSALAQAFPGRLFGHAHPRMWGRVRPLYEYLGIPMLETFDDVMARADLYICDNSSTQPESASIGIPQLFLNAPWYRRDVEHGGRFWDWPKGQISVDEPENLVGAAKLALVDPPEIQAARQKMVDSVYVATDGLATERAVAAISAILAIRQPSDPDS